MLFHVKKNDPQPGSGQDVCDAVSHCPGPDDIGRVDINQWKNLLIS
jgi:hypothetical protein